MNYKNLLDKYKAIEEKILTRSLQDGMNELYQLLKFIPKEDIRLQLDKHRDTYMNILKYAFEYQQDPEKEKIYNHMVVSILEILDEAREEITISNQLLTYHRPKKEVQRDLQNLSSTDSDELIEELAINKDLQNIITSTLGDDAATKAEYKKSIDKIFKILWLSDSFGDVHKKLIYKIIHNDNVDWFDKALVVSGVLLSVIRYFHIEKVYVLFDIVESKQNHCFVTLQSTFTIVPGDNQPA